MLLDVLQDVVLSYWTIPELIEAGVNLTCLRLINIVRNTFGAEFNNAESFKTLTEHSVYDNEGMTALILLQWCPPLKFYKYNYLAEQSYTFKVLVYPHLLSLLEQLDTERDRIDQYISLAIAESNICSTNSGLELMYNVIGSNLLSYLVFDGVVEKNPQFLLDHVHEFIITPEMVNAAFTVLNRGMFEVLLRQLVSPVNMSVLKEYDDVSSVLSFGDVLRKDAPDLYTIYEPFENVCTDQFRM